MQDGILLPGLLKFRFQSGKLTFQIGNTVFRGLNGYRAIPLMANLDMLFNCIGWQPNVFDELSFKIFAADEVSACFFGEWALVYYFTVCIWRDS